MADVFIRMPQLRESFGGVAKATVHNWVNSRLITPPVPIGHQSKAWPKSEIERIQAARIAGKSHDEIRALVASLVAGRSNMAEAA